MTTNPNQPKKLSQLYPPRFLSATELGAPVVITIQRATFEDCRSNEGEIIAKPIIYAQNAKRGVVLNKTNTKQLVELFGDIDFAALAGKRVTLYPCKHRSGKMMLCFREAPPAKIDKTDQTTSQDNPQP